MTQENLNKHVRRLMERREVEEKVSDKPASHCKSKLLQVVSGSTSGDLGKCADCDGYGIIYTGPEELREEGCSYYFDSCDNYEPSRTHTIEEVEELIRVQSSYDSKDFLVEGVKGDLVVEGHVSYDSVQVDIDDDRINPSLIGLRGRMDI